jgi:hypothetical protein
VKRPRATRLGPAPEGATVCPVTNKWRWATEEEVERERERILTNVRRGVTRGPGPQGTYECPWCAGWHFTIKRHERGKAA